MEEALEMAVSWIESGRSQATPYHSVKNQNERDAALAEVLSQKDVAKSALNELDIESQDLKLLNLSSGNGVEASRVQLAEVKAAVVSRKLKVEALSLELGNLRMRLDTAD